MKRLAIISTHPIQYNAPWFKLLAERRIIGLKVFYTWSQAKTYVKDHNFGKEISWDIPLLEGYDYEFVPNISKKPGSHHFMGINCPSLISTVEAYKADAILIFGWNFKSHFNVMRYFKGTIPVWFRGDSTLLDEIAGFKTTLRRNVLKFVYRYVDIALYVGNANKAYFLKHGLNEHQLVYVPHAIDNDRFNGSQMTYDEDAKKWREALGYSDDDVVILFAGKLEPKKQPVFLLKALQNANIKLKNPVKLLFVGAGRLEAELIELAKNCTNIQFQPFQNQSKMPVVYRLGDILCLPSKGPGETWGLAINEAMACGTPVMATDKVGCVYDILDSIHTGFIFKHNDIDALENIIETLNVLDLKGMGHAAKEHIRNWSFQKLVSTIETTLINEKQA